MVRHLAHQLVMHAQDDWIVVLLRPAHARHEDVARDCLHRVLGQLAAVRVKRLPLARVLVDAAVSDAVFPVDLRVDVAQEPARGQAHAQPAAIEGVGLHVEAQQAVAHLSYGAGLLYRPLGRALDVVPQ